MWSLILKALSWLAGRLFAKPPGPSPEAQQARQAAVAETTLIVEQQTNDQIGKAVAASRASDDAVSRRPGSLRDPDPDSRD